MSARKFVTSFPCERSDLLRQARVARFARPGAYRAVAPGRAINAPTGSQRRVRRAAAPAARSGERQATAVAANVLDRRFEAAAPQPQNGSPTSPMSDRQRAGSMWPPSSILFSRRVFVCLVDERKAMRAQLVTDALAMGELATGQT